jgi:membrane-associated phospholipid phosphatase
VTLPFLVRDRTTKWIYFLVGGAATLLLYRWTNRNPLTSPVLLEFGAVDKVMPFWTWTIWIYITEYLIFLCAYFGLRNKEHVTRYFYSYMAILLFSVVIFMIYPVAFPRADYPVTGNSISDQALIFLRTYMDEPANCLPSLHVSSCFVSSFCFWQEKKSKAAWYFLWSFLVSVSTMTTKQHYFVDVWTAFLLTLVAYWFFFYKVKLAGSGNEAGASR